MDSREPFPLLRPSADFHAADPGPRRRRKSSALGRDIEFAGDTGAPALATARSHDGLAPAAAAAAAPKRLSRRRKARSLFRRARAFAACHTWALPLLVLVVVLSLYALGPSESNPVGHFIFLSYRLPPDPASAAALPQYGKGPWDVALVAFYTVVLSFTREFVMQELLRPLARRVGVRARGKQARFMEQMYTAIYFGVLGPVGVFVMSRTPVWYFDTRGMYEAFPHHTHDAVFKFYYLFQAAYWAQQAIVLLLGMEKRRKDFRELVGHHIVSLALIGLSYRFHFTYIGLAIYITHDISDFFLATSKSLHYIDSPFVGPYYFLFMTVWIYLRHYINLRIIYSLFTDFKTVGPYGLDWDTEQFKCGLSFAITVSLLSALQALNLFWLFYVVRIAYRFIAGKEAKDDRSDDEEDDVPFPPADSTDPGEKPDRINGRKGDGYAARLPNGSAN